MGFVLDSGALVAFDRGDRVVAALLEANRRRGDQAVTSSGCVAQAWRSGGPKQALLARMLVGVDERPLGASVSRAIGALCAKAHTSDVVDAHVALLARNGDVVLTSDVADVTGLLKAARVRALVRRC